jgi:hypothetical protein
MKVVVPVLAAAIAAACVDMPAALTRQLEARHLASEMHVEFARASDASNRAVLADTDEASVSAAAEARKARQVVEKNLESLRPALESLGYTDDVRQLDAFKARYVEYRRLDDEILPLAVENTNLKAQRLSFGPSLEAAGAFRAALDAAARNNPRAGALAARAGAAVYEIQVLQAPHIAEAGEAKMAAMEQQMDASEATARTALGELKRVLGANGDRELAAATAALDRFQQTNGEIVALSRRNTNVRSLALSLGRKRLVSAECDDQLSALEQMLAAHQAGATR